MKTTIEKVTKTKEVENQFIIDKVMAKINGITRLDEAYKEVKNVIDKTLWDCGRGGSHIWVCNFANERLMLITETNKLAVQSPQK